MVASLVALTAARKVGHLAELTVDLTVDWRVALRVALRVVESVVRTAEMKVGYLVGATVD